jgi:transcriptional regulator with XRE-family HTH domain
MKDRILILMKAEGLTNSQFALVLGIQRSNITHILDGRNKPSMSFIEKLLLKFPLVNTEWLITGAGEMYKQSGQNKNDSPTLFTENNIPQLPETQEQTKPINISEPEPEIEQISEQTKQISEQTKEELELNSEQKTIIMEQKQAESPNPIQQNKEPNPEKTLTAPESDFVDKIKEHEIECVLIFYTDKTFKYYKPF